MSGARTGLDTATGERTAGSAVDAAEVRVTRAGVAFSASLRDASLAGRETAARVASAARPLLIGVGIVAGVVIVARLWQGPRQARMRRLPAAMSGRSPWSALARSAAVALGTMAARRLAERWLGPEAGRSVRRA